MNPRVPVTVIKMHIFRFDFVCMVMLLRVLLACVHLLMFVKMYISVNILLFQGVCACFLYMCMCASVCPCVCVWSELHKAAHFKKYQSTHCCK